MPPAYEVLLLNTAIPQIQAAQSGDTYVVPRDIAFSTQTQNGVPYFSGADKNLTSGSALTFDGTYFTANGLRLSGSDATNTIYKATGGLGISTGSASGITFYTNLANRYQIDSTGVSVWSVAGTEGMRLTTTGLGIGLGGSSPSVTLDVKQPTAGQDLIVGLSAGTGARAQIRSIAQATSSSSELGFYTTTGGSTNERARITSTGTVNIVGAGTAGSTQAVSFNGSAPVNSLVVDSAGNVGIGTSSPAQKLEVLGSSQAGVIYERISNNYGSSGSIGSGTGLQFYGWDAGLSAVIASLREATSYSPSYLSFQTFGGNGNTGANTLAERMRIDGLGNVGIGTSSPAAKLDVNGTARFNNTFDFGAGQSITSGSGAYRAAKFGSASGAYNVLFSGSTAFQINDNADTANLFVLTNSGNLGLGVTPSAWGSGIKSLDVNGSSFASSTATLDITQNAYYNGSAWIYKNTATANKYTQSGGVHYWYNAASGTAGNAITFTQALTLDANRNLLLNGTSAGASSVGTFAIFNGTAPTGSVTDGVILYAQDVSSSSELKVRDEAGNVTTLSPHNFSLIPEGPSEDMAWAYYSEKNGKRINVDMLKLARMIEKLTGEKLVFEA